ncbi:MAG: tRNA pseudouridine(55) synthase TruB [Burkholderiales bacterium]|nr:tRNA pseudouridine(55) synthase TruB [Burkholderiales bacterium]
MSRRRKGKKVDGVLLLDKPSGMTSNAALQKARRLFDAQKAGHVGTLDPLASGLLPLCFGEATKFASDLLNADKTYIAELNFGITTDTGDAEGKVLEVCEANFNEAQLTEVLKRFLGEQLQTPPMYSALKVNGQKLYDLARKGQTVEREARKIVISSLELLGFHAPKASIEVSCSKGTYIRVLGEDIGKALGCGAHLTALRRKRIRDLDIEEAVDFDQLENLDINQREALLLPVDRLLSSLPSIILDDQSAERFMNGQRQCVDTTLPPGLVRIYKGIQSPENLLGRGQLTTEKTLVPDRLRSTASKQTVCEILDQN